MKIKPLFSVYLIIVWFVSSYSEQLIAANSPLRLYLTRWNSANNSAEQPRTKAALFEDALNIRSNCGVDFDNKSWLLLKQCGLFSNLAANVSLVGPNRRVQIGISGIENPSRSISPQISFGVSDGNPIVSGTVSGTSIHIPPTH